MTTPTGALGTTLAQRPAVLPEMLLAAEFHLDTPKEIVIVAAAYAGSTGRPRKTTRTTNRAPSRARTASACE